MKDYADFYHSSVSPKRAAQAALEGKTHYVDEGTLSYFNCRIVQSGALAHKREDVTRYPFFYLVESLPIGDFNATRGFRYVIFDLFGTVVNYDNKSEQNYKTKNQALKAMWGFLNSLDFDAELVKSFENEIKQQERELEYLKQDFKNYVGKYSD